MVGLLSQNEQRWEEIALITEERVNLRDKYIRSFFKSPSDSLVFSGVRLNLAGALDVSYYGWDCYGGISN